MYCLVSLPSFLSQLKTELSFSDAGEIFITTFLCLDVIFPKREEKTEERKKDDANRPTLLKKKERKKEKKKGEKSAPVFWTSFHMNALLSAVRALCPLREIKHLLLFSYLTNSEG